MFLDLPAFAEQLSDWIEKQKHWRSNVRNFSLRYVQELQPRPITRDPTGASASRWSRTRRRTQADYVWFDAVIGYLSARSSGRERAASRPWREWCWTRTHATTTSSARTTSPSTCVIWPSMLLGYGAGGEYAPAGASSASVRRRRGEFLTMEGKQFSSSRDIVIDVLDSEPVRRGSRSGSTSARAAQTQDSDFTWVEFVRRNTTSATRGAGNLVNRTLTNTSRNSVEVPRAGRDSPPRTELARARSIDGFARIGERLESSKFKAR